ncbi:MAG: trehalose-6-phosphate synthase [Pseudomonadota bacterium]
MSRLVVISNRVADLTRTSQSGGLAVALGDALLEGGGLWFGWDGQVVEDDVTPQIAEDQIENVTVATTPLTQSEYQTYYAGMSNSVLWPVMHYRLDLARLDVGYLQGYRRVNARFADDVQRLIGDGDMVWIHDYHLIPLAAELRVRGIAAPIGFFHHTPFPPPEMFIALPGHDWLLRSFFSYDVVGFQTSADLQNFRRNVIEHLDGVDVDDDRISALGRTITAKVYPIGIDADAFRAMAETDMANAVIEQMQRRSATIVQIIGVDRLDYSKGLAERFRAFEMLLEQYPDNRGRVTLMQIAQPTREDVEAYADIREELERLSGAINGTFADFNWTPIRYLHRSIPRPTLAALFRGSRVGLVTPLRDGMNLVAKEYIAAQDPDDPGVLVLSQFAGAAEDLEEALQVNPHDVQELTLAIQRAIAMPKDERKARYVGLMDRIRTRDVTSWRTSFLADLRSSGARSAPA